MNLRQIRRLAIIAFSLTAFLALAKKGADPIKTWRTLLKERSECVTWVSATVKVEISSGGRSYPPQEQKLEALGTVLSNDGLVALSLTKVDPTASILSRVRGGGASVNVNYSEVNILMQDGSEVPAKLILKDSDLDLAFLLPLKDEEKIVFQPVPKSHKKPKPQPLDEVASLGKLSRNLYRQSTLMRGWVNAVIEKPRKYYVIDRLSAGTPVFDAAGNWLGIGVYKMVSGKPTQIVTLPAEDVLEIAEQVRKRIR
jgi:hypothetical protein